MPDPPFETFLTSCGLNGLCQKRCHILVINWIFDDPFPQKITSNGYFGASDDQIIRIRMFFWGNWTLEAVEANELAEAAEVNEVNEVSKTWKITTEDFRVVYALEFNNLRTNITLFWCFEKKNRLTESSKLVLNFSTFSVGGCWGQSMSLF